ncbi:hypothetical protein PtrSN002B_012213, partial [Pyrenophora tritici-repentis]
MVFSWGKGLPAELRLQIARLLAADASIADWVSVSCVSQAWREGTRLAFTEWVQSQELGVQFGHFAGRQRELSFVEAHVQVLVAEYVSVTYSVDSDTNVVLWWLTRESGGGPPSCHKEAKKCFYCAKLEAHATEDLRGA